MKSFYSTLSDNLSGVNSSLFQQILIAKLIIGISNLLNEKGKDLLVTPESDILNDDKFYYIARSKNADLVIWKYSENRMKGITHPLLIIELTNRPFPKDIYHSNNEDIVKIFNYFKYNSNVKECILYDYEKDEILKFTKNKSGNVEYVKNVYVTDYAKIQLRRYLHW